MKKLGVDNSNHVIFLHPFHMSIENWIALSNNSSNHKKVNSHTDDITKQLLIDSLGRMREESYDIYDASRITEIFKQTQNQDTLIKSESARSFVLHLNSGSLMLVTICVVGIKEILLNENMYLSGLLEDRYNNFLKAISNRKTSSIKKDIGEIPLASDFKNDDTLFLGENSCHTAFLLNDRGNLSSNIFQKLVSKNEIRPVNNSSLFTQINESEDYIFFGWSHSILSSKKTDLINDYLGSILLMQSIWFQYRSVRQRLSDSNDALLGGSKENLKNAELFNKASLKYNLWQNWVDIRLTNINPNTKEIIDHMWELWLMKDLAKGIDSSFRAIRDALNINHQIKSIKQEKTQNVILFLIGLLNLFGVFGSIGAYYRLYSFINLDIDNENLIRHSIDYGPALIFLLSAILLIVYSLRR